MEQSLFTFFFALTFIMFIVSIFYKADYQIQGIFAGISFIFFAILTIQSFNIETSYYDTNTGGFIYDRAANRSLEYLVPMGICLVLMIFSLLNTFIIFTYKAWDKSITQKPMKIGGKNDGSKL